MSKRGFVPEDVLQFNGEQLKQLKKAASEVQFLLNQGYGVKQTTTFVGNHYMFSERQRLALARSVSPADCIVKRKCKELLQQTDKIIPKTVNIDGFNTIITLEVALSGSPVFSCGDGTIRDLAGLRGTYRIIDKTQIAIELILEQLEILKIENACFYLDAPVSNSGRLSALIRECAKNYNVLISIKVINEVDRMLEQLDNVISGDAIILNKCTSWLNIMPDIIKRVENVWMIHLQ